MLLRNYPPFKPDFNRIHYGGPKMPPLPTSFSSVTSANVGISPKTF